MSQKSFRKIIVGPESGGGNASAMHPSIGTAPGQLFLGRCYA